MNLKIIHKNFTDIIELNWDAAPETCLTVYNAVPFQSYAEKWKQEIYFKISVKIRKENQSAKVEKGDVAYFPPMSVLCVFYSTSQPVAPVNIIGKVRNPEKFAEIKEGDLIRIERE
jgi:hypothetical protein